MCSLPLPFSLTQCPRSATVQASSSSHSHSSCMTSFTSNPGVPPWLLRWGCPLMDSSSHLVALVTRLFSVLDFRKAWSAFFFFFFRRRGVLRIFPGEYHLLFLFFDMIYAV